jgi:hypothetical protein
MRPMPCGGDAYSGHCEGKERSCCSCTHSAPEVQFGTPPPVGASGGKCAGFRGWELMVPAMVTSTHPGWKETPK